jgi:DNA-binding transcriptional MerR regulator
LDKAPDAFRTISEVAKDLEIPQHVLRFWETRFTQIKPMKRSGGRRYYRPDDVDLLRGIRRLLYGEGYTIRGVQRILKEHGVKSVQSLVEGSSTPAFGAVEDEIGRSISEDEFDLTAALGIDADDDDYESEGEEDDDEPAPVVAARAPEPRASELRAPEPRAPEPRAPERREIRKAAPALDFDIGPIPGVESEARQFDFARLQSALDDLVAAKIVLDAAFKDA